MKSSVNRSRLSSIKPHGSASFGTDGADITATWNMNMKKGQVTEVTYRFKAPDQSPYLFELGPIVMKSTDGTIIFQEERKWQIASDAAGKAIVFWDQTRDPAGWTCVSCVSGDPFLASLAMGSSSYGGTGGTATHTPTAAATVY